MANGKLFNRVGMTTATTGTGTITLGSAITSPKKYQSFATAGVANNDVVEYLIEDGVEFELGLGTYTSSGTTLSRDTVRASSNGGSKVNLSGSALVYIDAAAEDLPPSDKQTFNASGTWTKPQGNYRYALIEAWGPGGSGGCRTTTGNASGGGGGSYNFLILAFSSLGATETVTVGTGGAAVTTSNANGNDGAADTTFGSWLTGYKGGGGANAAAGAQASGGGGGGLTNGATGSTGGDIEGKNGAINSATAASGRHGGASGGGVNSSNSAFIGGNAYFGGAGGGAASGTTPSDTAGGTSVKGGNGGAGSGTVNGADGTQPGGGGGAARNGKNSGKGGDGRVVVTCW